MTPGSITNFVRKETDMNILALDSTAEVASVSICRDEKPLAIYTVKNGNTHSQTLLPMIESALKHSGLTVNDIELFAASEGPGSFTGVRIGAATLKGLAFGRSLPCVAVSTLHALAHNLIGFEGVICPVMNARRAQVYNALFIGDGVSVERLTPDRAIAISELEAELEAFGGKKIYLVGDGYYVTKNGFSRVGTAETPEALRMQNAYSVAVCALNEYKRGCFKTDSEITATYLRLSQAERERLERENNVTV